MYQTSISSKDLDVQIKADFRVSLNWEAQFIDSKTLEITLRIDTAMQGNESLIVKFINYKVIRGVNGGCVKPEAISTAVPSSLFAEAEKAEVLSKYSKFLIVGGVISLFAIVKFCAESFEMIWSLVNTLQLISYLPLMIAYYPDHVKIMFEILKFVNLEFEFLADMFKRTFSIEGIETPSFSERFDSYGIESTLFLDNCASLITSFLISLLTLGILVTIHPAICITKLKNMVGNMISSYFWNNFLRFFTEGYIEIFFGALLNVVMFNYETWHETISLALSGIICILSFIFPLVTFAMLYDKREKIKKGEYQEKFGTMFADFKLTKGWYSFQYYSAFLIRRFLYIFMLIVGISQPVLQCNLFVLASFLVSEDYSS